MSGKDEFNLDLELDLVGIHLSPEEDAAGSPSPAKHASETPSFSETASQKPNGGEAKPESPGDPIIQDLERSADPAESTEAPEEEQKEKSGEERSSKSGALSLLDWVQSLTYAVVIGVLLFTFLMRPITVEGSSMQPTLYNGDEVLLSGLFYHPRQGDIVVLRKLTYNATPLIKRIIAVEGQTVDIDFENGEVTVDGVVLQESYIAALTNDRESFSGPVTVPEGHVFVMGDNRNASTDSRSASIGMIDERSILGRVYFLLFSTDERTGKRDWSRMGRVG